MTEYRADRATVEHLQRREDGGKTVKDNLAIACHPCNSSRGRVDWLTYKTWVMENCAFDMDKHAMDLMEFRS